jgi:hypothetical protein
MQARFASMQPINVRAIFFSTIRSAICLCHFRNRMRAMPHRIVMLTAFLSDIYSSEHQVIVEVFTFQLGFVRGSLPLPSRREQPESGAGGQSDCLLKQVDAARWRLSPELLLTNSHLLDFKPRVIPGST